MREQISFLPEIDRKETQKKVEEVLESVRIYKQIGFIRREMKTTPAYTPRYHSQTYSMGNPAEETAIWNAEKEQELENLEDNLDRALNRLSRIERAIIQKRYLEDEDAFDYMIHNELGMSARTYGRVKSRAFYKLAFMLRLEVVKGEEN
ncbi:ArpU family phage packaging/lysis transcriptional regulator [Domibacillus aminovorans]|uniref:ArpU family transcriptional regulator n=1 Tax=Domibacillus aminovorans TaxID=29332 RepID=A0A177L386_9BACI|nr:ArpU family phage packaging/lysis transcriptional regulator [Domibacillus aminovorans]OAH60139.1 ArpU family transcriptional regulator [Domibacillus aminovorans]